VKKFVLIAAILQLWLTPAFCLDPPLLLNDSFESVIITSFRASPDAVLEVGNTTISWATAYATSCTPSGGTGGWDLLDIDLPSGSALIDLTTLGTHTFTLACVGADSSIAIANEVVTVSNPVSISSFGALPNSFLEGGNTTISWTTADATSCTPSGGAGGWDALTLELPNGSALIDIATAGTHTFTLTCDGAGGSAAVETAVVTVSRPVTVSSFGALPDSILEGGSTTLSWATADATSCTPSGGTGGWDALTLELPNGSALIDIASAGTYTFTLTCDGAEGSTAVETEVVTVSPPVTISSFSALPDAFIEGGNTTISWTTTDATSCTPSGGAGGWDTLTLALPDGSALIDIATAGTYTFTLTCDGAEGSTAVETAVVTVSPDSNPNCDPSPLAGVIEPWASFWGVEFPGPSYDTKHAAVPGSGYLALEFNTGNVDDWAIVELVNSTWTSGIRTGAYSECPGDFDVTTECIGSWGTGDALTWSTNDRFGACQLKANTTYYFNMTFTDGFDPKSSTCESLVFDRQCYARPQYFNR